MNKKAIAESALITIILALAVGIVLTGGIIRYNQTVKKESPIDVCRANAILSANSKQFIPLSKCETIVTELDVDKKAPQSVQKTQAMRSYAKLIGDCWYEMGEGKLNLWKGDWTGLNNICFVFFQFTSPVSFSNSDFNNWLDDQSEAFAENIRSTAFSHEGVGNFFIEKYDFNVNYIFRSMQSYTSIHDPINPEESYSIVFIGLTDKRARQFLGLTKVESEFGTIATVPTSKLSNIECSPTFINIKE